LCRTPGVHRDNLPSPSRPTIPEPATSPDTVSHPRRPSGAALPLYIVVFLLAALAALCGQTTDATYWKSSLAFLNTRRLSFPSPSLKPALTPSEMRPRLWLSLLRSPPLTPTKTQPREPHRHVAAARRRRRRSASSPLPSIPSISAPYPISKPSLSLSRNLRGGSHHRLLSPTRSVRAGAVSSSAETQDHALELRPHIRGAWTTPLELRNLPTSSPSTPANSTVSSRPACVQNMSATSPWSLNPWSTDIKALS
jgi:hypothetical protein